MVYMQSIKRQVVLPCCCAVLEPDVVPLHHRYCSRQEWAWWVSILIDNGVCSRSKDKLCYSVVVQYLSQMLCPFSTDLVPLKIKSVECLYWSIMVCMQSIKRQVVLPCCCAVLEPDAVPLHHRYCLCQDRECLVSVLIDNGVNAVEEKTSCVTVLLYSAWARYCAPSAPILFPSRLRVLSVYIDR
jgi:hypothetical protein